MIELIDNMIKEAKKLNKNTRYLVAHPNVTKIIPSVRNAKGDDKYKGLKVEPSIFCDETKIYLSQYKIYP
jgi:hypothetical protein